MTRTFSWQISDELWSRISQLVPRQEELRDPDRTYSRRSGAGRKSKYDDRTFFSAILYVLRTGVQWNALPRDLFDGMSSTTAFEKFQQWTKAGFFDRIWKADLVAYDDFEGITGGGNQPMVAKLKRRLARRKMGLEITRQTGKKCSKVVASNKRKRRSHWNRNEQREQTRFTTARVSIGIELYLYQQTSSRLQPLFGRRVRW